MTISNINRIRFSDLPTTYLELCQIHLPRPIHDEIEYQNTLATARVFAGFEEQMTADQGDYFDLLTSILERWEAVSSEWRDVPALEILKQLLEEHDLSGADLSRVLGASRHLGPMILRGERSITAEHARKLGVHFGLPAGAFLG